MVVGVLQLEVRVPDARSLKDRRSMVKRLKDQIRGRFNVSVAELAPGDTWQRATLGIAAVGDDRRYVEGMLTQVTEWVRMTRLVDLIRVAQECL
jgi:uncharacterized protein YlxP (DUF503 family)